MELLGWFADTAFGDLLRGLGLLPFFLALAGLLWVVDQVKGRRY